MTIIERIKSLVHLGEVLSDLESSAVTSVLQIAEIENPWFTQQYIRQSLISIRDKYLTENALSKLVTKYHLDENIEMKRVGIILAGNIPLVGFHDILCCFLAGHQALLKYSDKDKVLMKWAVNLLKEFDHQTAEYFIEVEKLQNYDAAIATGSNTTATHFEYYFRNVPHLIRKNRNSIAVLSGTETKEQLQNLGTDIFSYFGLGCRNVSMIYVPNGYEIRQLFVAFESFSELIHHNKYKNNFDYNHALMLLNKEEFLQNEFLILKKSDQIVSRIASVHYHYYSDISSLSDTLMARKDEIQCVVSANQIPRINVVDFGSAQAPDIDDFADGVDTMQFLLSL